MLEEKRVEIGRLIRSTGFRCLNCNGVIQIRGIKQKIFVKENEIEEEEEFEYCSVCGDMRLHITKKSKRKNPRKQVKEDWRGDTKRERFKEDHKRSPRVRS